MPATQLDVASIAGVSRKTVSNVVNGYPHVSADVVTRVEAAISELGYTPSRAARSLRTGRTSMIQLIIPELDVSYFAELAHWVVADADAKGLGVIISQTLGDPDREQHAIDGDLAEYADGSILSPVSSDVTTITHRRTGSPIVLVGELMGEGSLTHIGIDNVVAARQATEHLIERGYSRIAFIGAQRGKTSRMAQMRLNGYRSALQAAGLIVDDDLVADTTGYHRPDGAAAMHAILDHVRPDAVFCATDLLAMGAMRAARDRGLKVPDDIAFAGFDDIEEGRFSSPSLTTVAPDKRRIAELAVDCLIAEMSGALERPDPAELQVPFTIAVRESS